MSFWKKILKQNAYHVTHPLLRLSRQLLPAKASARALILFKDEILLIRNIGVPYWSLPGGTIEKEENPEEALLRELKEELSLNDLRIEFRLGTYLSERRGKAVPVYIYVVRASSLLHKKLWEIDDACWFLLSELPPNLSPATRMRIAEYKNGGRDLEGTW